MQYFLPFRKVKHSLPVPHSESLLHVFPQLGGGTHVTPHVSGSVAQNAAIPPHALQASGRQPFDPDDNGLQVVPAQQSLGLLQESRQQEGAEQVTEQALSSKVKPSVHP